MSATPRLLDVVALREDVEAEHLVCGQVGTVVEVMGPDAFLVEFADRNGRTYAMVELVASQVVVLKYEPVAA